MTTVQDLPQEYRTAAVTVAAFVAAFAAAAVGNPLALIGFVVAVRREFGLDLRVDGDERS
jgi:hypothetical protein